MFLKDCYKNSMFSEKFNGFFFSGGCWPISTELILQQHNQHPLSFLSHVNGAQKGRRQFLERPRNLPEHHNDKHEQTRDENFGQDLPEPTENFLAAIFREAPGFECGTAEILAKQAAADQTDRRNELPVVHQSSTRE